MIEGIAAILIGVFLWMRWPSDATWLIGLLVGIRFLLAGLPILLFGLRVRRVEG